jgi:hypothetical protein
VENPSYHPTLFWGTLIGGVGLLQSNQLIVPVCVQKFATKFQVEALPAFVVMHKFVKKRHVVGTDDLKKAIEDAHAKFGSETKEPAQNSEPKEPAQNCENFHVQIKMLLESL